MEIEKLSGRKTRNHPKKTSRGHRPRRAQGPGVSPRLSLQGDTVPKAGAVTGSSCGAQGGHRDPGVTRRHGPGAGLGDSGVPTGPPLPPGRVPK